MTDPALRAEVDRLRTQVTTLTSVATGLATLADKVTVLSERVSALATAPAAPRPAAGGSWFEATPEQATAMLADLASWVDGVLWHYRAAEVHLSDCWFRHPAVVEALLSLQAAWHGAYRPAGGGTAAAGATAAAEWHHRHLPGVANLLREELRGCSESNHRPGGNLSSNLRPQSRPVPQPELLQDTARAWAGRSRP